MPKVYELKKDKDKYIYIYKTESSIMEFQQKYYGKKLFWGHSKYVLSETHPYNPNNIITAS